MHRNYELDMFRYCSNMEPGVGKKNSCPPLLVLSKISSLPLTAFPNWLRYADTL